MSPKYLIALSSIFLWLTACGEKPAEAPAVEIRQIENTISTAAIETTTEENLKIAQATAESSNVAIINQRSQPSSATPKNEIQRIDAYLSSLKTAAYIFNPPSPIRVAEPVTVHLWLDPQATTIQLTKELKKVIPQDAAQVESGLTKWSPKMRATLSGPNFDVKAIDKEEQLVSSTQRTTWSWDITPLSAGKEQALHLRIEAILPSGTGSKTITTLDRNINVEVTIWWLLDHYFEKYWKWILGGLATTMASIFIWWQNRRLPKNSETVNNSPNVPPEQQPNKSTIRDNKIASNKIGGSLVISSHDTKGSTIEGNEITENTVKGNVAIGVNQTNE